MQIFHTCGYYFIADNTKSHDSELAKMVSMDYMKFKEHIINQFDAVEIAGQCYFKKKKDAEKCLDWMIPLITMNILSGSEANDD